MILIYIYPVKKLKELQGCIKITHIKYQENTLSGKVRVYYVRRPYHKPYNRLEQKDKFKFELNEFEKLIQSEYDVIQYKTN